MRAKKELKAKVKENEELNMELADVKTQLRTRDQKIKKLSEENAKLFDDKVVPTNKVIYQNNNNSNSSPDSLSVEHYKRQIRILEEKLKRQRPAERPYEQAQRSASPQKAAASAEAPPEKEVIIRTVHMRAEASGESVQALKRDVEQWRTR